MVCVTVYLLYNFINSKFVILKLYILNFKWVKGKILNSFKNKNKLNQISHR